MPIGIQNLTAVTLDNLTSISNQTTTIGFVQQVNNVIYGGWMFFILLSVVALVVLLGLIYEEKEPVPSAIAVCFAFSILSILSRAAGLLTDKLAWVFPIITVLLIALLYATKQYG
jgi:hypothetical protein